MQPEPYLKPDNQKANPNLIIRSLADNLTRHWCLSSPSQPGSQHLREKALHAAAYKPYRRMLRGFRLQREGGKEGEGCEKRCCVPVACIESQGPAALYLPLLCAPPSPRSAVQEAGGCSQDPCSRAGPGASTASQLQVPAQQHPAGRERPLLGGISWGTPTVPLLLIPEMKRAQWTVWGQQTGPGWHCPGSPSLCTPSRGRWLWAPGSRRGADCTWGHPAKGGRAFWEMKLIQISAESSQINHALAQHLFSCDATYPVPPQQNR